MKKTEKNVPAAVEVPSIEPGTDYVKAAELNHKIIAAAQVVQNSLYEMCTCLKEMRDGKHYKFLGYKTFEDYCERQVGLKRSQVYNYIKVVEALPADFVQSIGQNLGMTKMLLLTNLSEEERTEVTQNSDLEKTSVKELQSKIADLKAHAEKLAAKIESEQEATKKARAEGLDAIKRAGILETDKSMALKRISQLESEIEELKSRPAEVVQTVEVVPDGYVSASDLEAKEKQLEAERAELEKQLAAAKEQLAKAEAAEPETVTVVDNDGVFKAYFANAYNAFDALATFVKEHKEYMPKVSNLLDAVHRSLEV